MILGLFQNKREQMLWIPPKAPKDAEKPIYTSGVTLGTMKPIGGAPVNAFCCPDCMSIFIDGAQAKRNNK